MNERIKELALQAGFIGESMNPIIGTSQATALENFAQLIVRECEVALSPMLRDMISRGQAYDLIKQHFGLTE